jgi:toxin CcdB
MATFDIYQDGRGYLLDVQSDLLDGLNTVLIVPLMPPDIAPKAGAKLNPIFDIGGGQFVMVTQYMAATPVRALGRPVGNLKVRYYDQIKAAIDMVFLGF